MSWDEGLLVLGHRGYSSAYPENTLLSFEEALRSGADGSELDVRLTKDGKAVVLHDETLSRVAGVERRVDELTFEELRGVRLGMGQRVPSLKEALGVGGLLNVEVKVVEAAIPSLKVVVDGGALDRVLFSSFSLEALRLIRAASKRARIGLLTQDVRSLSYLPRLNEELGLYSLNLPIEGILVLGLERFLKVLSEASDLGLKVILWPFNDDLLQAWAPKLAGMVKAVITDDPPRMIKSLGRRGPTH